MKLWCLDSTVLVIPSGNGLSFLVDFIKSFFCSSQRINETYSLQDTDSSQLVSSFINIILSSFSETYKTSIADNTLPAHAEPARQKMAQSLFNGATQPVDMEAESPTLTADRQ